MKAIKILMKVVLTIVFMYVISAQINMIYEHLHIDIVTYTQVIIVITCILMFIATWWKFRIYMGQIMKYICYLLISIALFLQYFITGWTCLTRDENDDTVFLFWVYDLPLLLSLFVLIFSYYFIYKLPVKKRDE
ncbi:hypothetical protein [Butyricimonas synergistica]|uniref:hypothetical protein n=1 Tax=Butyricimonas synergistica TaxID=544644 RepID=UPI00037FCFA1|nr:hypothetical protein [Butyricimonas synergistica]